MNKKVSILVLAFNRPDNVAQALIPVSLYQPDRLYLACDGPRAGKDGETELVTATQKAMLEAVNWTCEVKTLFRDINLGCAKAVYEAITWFFKHEEYGIIIEDDVVVEQTFFMFCEELLPLYKDESRVMHITSENHSGLYKRSNSYTFNKRPYVWGWATWRRAWNLMDMNMTLWPSFPKWRMIPYYGVVQTFTYVSFWNKLYKDLDISSSWATRWHFAIWWNGGLCLSPWVHLSKNIGTEGGTHFSKSSGDTRFKWKNGELVFPLKINRKIAPDMLLIWLDNIDWWRLRIWGLWYKVRRLWNE